MNTVNALELEFLMSWLVTTLQSLIHLGAYDFGDLENTNGIAEESWKWNLQYNTECHWTRQIMDD